MPDRYGYINEDYFSLRSPRMVDETNPTLEGIVKDAVHEMQGGGVKKIAIFTDLSFDSEGVPFEGTLLLTLEAGRERGDELQLVEPLARLVDVAVDAEVRHDVARLDDDRPGPSLGLRCLLTHVASLGSSRCLDRGVGEGKSSTIGSSRRARVPPPGAASSCKLPPS